MATNWFDCENSTLVVTGPASALELFEWLLKPRQLQSQPHSSKTVTISISEGRSSAPEASTPFDDVLLESGCKLKVFQQDNVAFIAGFENGLSIELQHGGDAIIYGFDPSNYELKGFDDLQLLALDHCITAMGQSFIHAACLEMPDGGSSMLIHAASGTGKTTTSFAMIEKDYRIISDDAAVMRHHPDTDRIVAWGVPRAPKVHENTVRALPFLEAHFDAQKTDKDGEQFLDRQALVEAQIIKDSSALPVTAVVSVSRDTSRPPSIVKVSAFDALSDMLEDNLSSWNGSLMPIHQDRLTAYGNLVRRSICYRVNINGTPAQTANMIASQIAQDS